MNNRRLALYHQKALQSNLKEMKSLKKNAKAILTRCLIWATYSRSEHVRDFAWRRVGPKGQVFAPPDSTTRVLFGGDVSFAPEMQSPHEVGVYRSREKVKRGTLAKVRRKFWAVLCKICFSPRFFTAKIVNATFKELLVKAPANEKKFQRQNKNRIYFDVDYSSSESKFAYPFAKLAPFMREKDLVLVNLETPLTSHPRVRGLLTSDPNYAPAMKEAGISMVSLANNHIFDVGENGFLHTLTHLKEAGITYVGAGKDFNDARLGRLVHLNGTTLAFLNYTNHCNSGFVSIAAEYPGILPLDPELIVEDIQVAQKKAKLVLVLLHWGFENQPNVHPKQVEIAHRLVDAGADAIIGHHPHVPHGIEVYKGKPILYSLGNFIFGYGRKEWTDNTLAEIIIDRERIQGVIVYPVSGQGDKLFQPERLNGPRADALLYELQIKSAVFDTGIAIQDQVGYIKINDGV